MRVTREQMAEHRRKILESAGKLFRAKGFDAVTVADVMQAAGLTHGGFYGHFKSKDDLIAETVAHALAPKAALTAKADAVDLAAFTKSYLSPRHRDDLAGGCPTAGLAAETIRQAPAARAAMTAGLRETIERMSRGAPGGTAAERRRAAIGSWSAMVGALVLARLSDDLDLSDEMLRETRAWLEQKAKAGGRQRARSR
jgi:TetR/AcrR family transcriptional regulator, transcriptional repressor for nem operon